MRLFEEEPDRLSRLAHEVSGIYFDWSKTHLDAGLVEAFAKLAEKRGPGGGARRLVRAAKSSTRPRTAPPSMSPSAGRARPTRSRLPASRRKRMRALVDAIEAGAFGDVTGILHIGIGGSVLGPGACWSTRSARRGRGSTSASCRTSTAQAFEQAVEPLDPATTLVVAVSKTFTTTETLSNLSAALDWLREAGVADPEGRVIAVTADAARRRSKPASTTAASCSSREGVGGRYSLWSSVSVTAALALGWDAFEELLEGAAAMDRHFRFTEPPRNVPLLAAFADLFYTQTRRRQTRGGVRL